MASEVDVLVVGAGAAGLAAGKRLQAAGVSFRVLEARERIGGRAWTDRETLGLPFDRGCHWLHSASLNPLREIADRIGRRYVRQDSWGERALYVAGRQATRAEWEACEALFDQSMQAISRAGRAGRDEAAASVVDRADQWFPLLAHVYTLISSGELDEVSMADAARYRDTDENWPMVEGLGALVAAHAEGLPVELSTPVERLEVASDRVTAATARGSIRARAAIVAVSTSVLADGRIRVAPDLPPDRKEAIEACRLGVAEKVAFRLDRPLEGFPDGAFASVAERVDPARTPQNFYVNPFGQPLVLAHLGGRHARALAAEGDAAMIVFATDALAEALGSGIRKRIQGATATRWVTDPYIGGGYSFARPGKAGLRRRLGEPHAERVLFAGEATSLDFFSTAHGAHLTGIRAAEEALALIGRSAGA